MLLGLKRRGGSGRGSRGGERGISPQPAPGTSSEEQTLGRPLGEVEVRAGASELGEPRAHSRAIPAAAAPAAAPAAPAAAASCLALPSRDWPSGCSCLGWLPLREPGEDKSREARCLPLRLSSGRCLPACVSRVLGGPVSVCATEIPQLPRGRVMHRASLRFHFYYYYYFTLGFRETLVML